MYHDVAEGGLTKFHPWLENNYIHFGTMVTGEQFIVDEQRDSINQRYAPLCVDMETASVAHICHVNKFPFLSVRTITDTAEHKGEESFAQNCKTASCHSAEIVMGILEQLSC